LRPHQTQSISCLARRNMSSPSDPNVSDTGDATGAVCTSKATCIPCHSLNVSAILSRKDVDEELGSSLQLWDAVELEEGNICIERSFTAKNFMAALQCINEMGAIAEREGHHPDFHLTGYRNVKIVMFTHKLGGVTTNDLQLAKMLDTEVTVQYSPKWLQSHPEAKVIALK